MKAKFILKAKDLDKKWLRAIRDLYGKERIVVTIQTEQEAIEEEFMDELEYEEEDDEFFNHWLNQFEEDEDEEEEEEEVLPEPEPVVKKTRGRKKQSETVAETPQEVVAEKPRRGRKKKVVEAVETEDQA